MIEEIGTVTAVEDGHIWVETQIKSTCGACAANDNCGTGVVAKAFAPKKDVLMLPCSEHAEIGQQVKIGIPENHLLSASALVYMLPLVVLVFSTLLFQSLVNKAALESELWVITGAALSTFLSFVWVKRTVSVDKTQKYQPRLIALLSMPEEQIQIRQISV